ncbi:MAG: IclR family transcriptional regulator, partial [Pigmentiphaga sp.]
RVGDGVNYRLGAAVLRLGFEYLASMELTEHGRPIIDHLRDVSGYSAHLVVRDGREVVFVGKAPSRVASFHSIQVGARLPAHATVLGRLLLADLDLAELKRLYPQSPLPAFTAQTPTTHEDLLARAAQDRERGYGVSQAGYESGISTIAAPVHNEHRQTVAAVSITVPDQRVPEAELPRLIDQVKAAAAELSARMSHAPNVGQSLPVTSEKTMV